MRDKEAERPVTTQRPTAAPQHPTSGAEGAEATSPVLALTGTWEFWPITPEEEAAGAEPWWPDFAGGRWQPIRVPGHWQAQGVDHTGTAWYRRRFVPPPLPADRVPYLEFDGVDYRAEVWLNGQYLGTHEGEAEPFAFRVARALQPGEENLLVVRVEAPLDPRPEHKRIAKGGTYHWDCLPVDQRPLPDCPEVPSSANPQYPRPVTNPGGIWREVRLHYRPPVHIVRVDVQSWLSPDHAAADLVATIQVANEGPRPRRAAATLRLQPDNFTGDAIAAPPAVVTLPPGLSTHTLALRVERPALWWTWDRGYPHLYRLAVELQPAEPVEGFPAPVRTELRVGIRSFHKDPEWGLYLNGQRIFARGTNYLSAHFLTAVDPEQRRRDVALMREANMNMVRVFSHVEPPEFYDACDELGILVWQDLPFQWGYESSPEFIARAVKVARGVVEQLRSRPSVVLWCLHSESRLHDYNKLDEALWHAVAAADPTRPIVKDSVLAHPGDPPAYFRTLEDLDRFTRRHFSVLWNGWYWGALDDVEVYRPYFVTECGTQSLPGIETLREMLSPGELWPPDYEAWRRRGFQPNIYRRWFPQEAPSLEAMVAESQEYQARFYRRIIESLRRRKYQPTSGVLQFHFVDAWPAITWSILDYKRRPKAAFAAVRAAFAPVLLTFTLEPVGTQGPGTGAADPPVGTQGPATEPADPSSAGPPAFILAAWVVNDTADPVAAALLSVTATDATGAVVLEERRPVQPVDPDASQVVARWHLPGVRLPLTVRATLMDRDGRPLATAEAEVTPPAPPTGEIPAMV